MALSAHAAPPTLALTDISMADTFLLHSVHPPMQIKSYTPFGWNNFFNTKGFWLEHYWSLCFMIGQGSQVGQGSECYHTCTVTQYIKIVK